MLLQDDVVLETVRAGALAGWRLRFADPLIAQPAFLHELLLRALWRLLAWLAGGQLPAARFDFAFASPPYTSGYAKIFPAPLQFEQPQSAVWFEAERLQRPVRRDEAALRAFLADAQAQIVVPRRGDDEVGARVRSHLLRTPAAMARPRRHGRSGAHVDVNAQAPAGRTRAPHSRR